MGNRCWIYRRRPIPNHTGKPKGEILTLKIVIDTNVVISALFFGGNPQDLLQLVIGKTLDAYASPSIIEEYNEVMDRIAKKYPRKKGNFSLQCILPSFQLVYPSQKITVCRDPDDNKFIECAIEAGCQYIISGDDDLLSLRQIDSTEIITVSDFFVRFNNTPPTA